MTIALIDLDIIVNKDTFYALAEEEDWDHTESVGMARIRADIEDWTTRAGCTTSLLFRSCCRSSGYRRQVYESYKASRDRTTGDDWGGILMANLWQRTTSTYPVIDGEDLSLEADDLLGIYGQTPGTVMVTIDKDLRTVPGVHFNPDKDLEPVTVTPEEAQKARLRQWLTGDSTDNIPGIPGIGPKKADKILGGDGLMGELALQAYLDKGIEEYSAVVQWILVSILYKHSFGTWTLSVPAPCQSIFEAYKDKRIYVPQPGTPVQFIHLTEPDVIC